MNIEVMELKIVGVEQEDIQKDNSFPGAFTYPFKLSSVPSFIWASIFKQVYANNFNGNAKRNAYISGDRIITVLANTDDKQYQENIVKRAVADTNARYKKVCKEMVAKDKNINSI